MFINVQNVRVQDNVPKMLGFVHSLEGINEQNIQSLKTYLRKALSKLIRESEPGCSNTIISNLITGTSITLLALEFFAENEIFDYEKIDAYCDRLETNLRKASEK